MHNNSLPGDYNKLNILIIRITCLCWLPVKVLGWRMFTTNRLFPTAPVFEITGRFPPAIHIALFSLSILLLFLLLISPKNKIFLAALLGAEIISCLLDQNRIQPWDYLYMFTLFIFIVNTGNQKLATIAFAFILASTYFYSGLGKLNEGFLQTIWSKMILHLFLRIPAKTAQQGWLFYGGYCAGFFELTAGLGLLFTRTRRIAAGLLILMHLFILIFLGPPGLNYNRIVWPWNMAMILYLYLIFFKNNKSDLAFKHLLSGRNVPVLICWGILPAFNLAGYWDNYLSSAMYSGKLPQMIICVKDTSKCPGLRRFCKPDYRHLCNDYSTIDLGYWALSETNVAPYPEIRVYKKIQHQLEIRYPAAGLSFNYLVEGKQQK
ncbi:hypothetical protein [Mucilaginibacter gotjawali]|uniref:Uncharacterized protein n=2 Tax=Mucilaginibacter gotjawali TaxID=1550579 RepID=A0A0X8X1N8_9SPHI|nr:hypothetical protein [Mucilaginibacter gotjawali]MBB3053741.1 putative membrane protein YphA (DoxX/SURF4 family) [Mucilaginibacter gotjawali]BAU54001.1 hypothetical protein MgSA37_02172 [Mucilaginibacter gotjawali]